MRFFRAAAGTVAILMTASCMQSVSSSDGVVAPAKAKTYFTNTNDIVVTGQEAIKGEKKVVIGSFNVGFVEEKKAKSTAQGGLLGTSAGRASATAKLLNVPDSVMQAITDAAYQDFVAQLKANGYEVVDRSTITGLESFKKMNTEESPQRGDAAWVGGSEAVFFAPKGMKLALTGEKAAFGAGGFGFANPAVASVQAAKEGKVAVINASYLVDFANAETYGGYFKSTAAVKLGQSLSVVPGSNVKFYSVNGANCVGYCPQTFTEAKLGQAVYSEETFGEVVNTTTDAEKALTMATNVVSALGGLGTRQSGSFDIKADTVKYQALSLGLLKTTNEKLVKALGNTPPAS